MVPKGGGFQDLLFGISSDHLGEGDWERAVLDGRFEDVISLGYDDPIAGARVMMFQLIGDPP